MAPLFLQIVGLLASLQTARLLKSLGRKETIQYGAFYMGMALLIVALCFLTADEGKLGGILIVIGLIVARGIFSLMIGPVVWICIP